MKRICSKCSRVRFPARLLDMRKTQFVEPTLYYNVIPTKSCRDAFLRLSKPPGLRKRRFHSAFLLAETQECVSTLCNDRLCAQAEIRRIHVKYTVIFIYATKNVRFPTKNLGKRTCTCTRSYPVLTTGKRTLLNYQFALLNASPPRGEERTLLDNYLECIIIVCCFYHYHRHAAGHAVNGAGRFTLRRYPA